ncbi:MAG: hypothetical protein ACTSXZ_06025 [Alphaproteobacteria bacterium]
MRIPSIRSIPMAAAFGFAAWMLWPAAPSAEGPSARVPSGDAAQIRCLCRYAGTTYEQAECACLPTPAGPRLACCGKVLNNSSWMFIGDACTLSQIRPADSGGGSLAERPPDAAEAAPRLARRTSEPR